MCIGNFLNLLHLGKKIKWSELFCLLSWLIRRLTEGRKNKNRAENLAIIAKILAKISTINKKGFIYRLYIFIE